ncbi:MSMEG_1061 family FMN-dependent PPOX-type flavoprotein [Roseateles albus]|uniref:Pyridoxamine 5'-phosphate oxidase family protein n=1 Tax=Roseateles albus TaxID=2987525 RepID=A0ABT5K7Z8_9BURK|nr:MSMEG_1061 family FMN-dependent PPOX-type flavoprotein [Roseateles albus]MDC8770077.1 pyridoxamine 5'-phosphate oxidase family protein [Roseateles albus]
MKIETNQDLRAYFGEPQERALKKEIAFLDKHCLDFIRLSPFLILASADADFNMDASPRGGLPGFVKVNQAGELLIPEAPGNKRIDTLQNVLATRKAGLIFLIPGFNETLRVNGAASLSFDAADLEACRDEKRLPQAVIKVIPEAAYLHCAKAFLRSKLWKAEAQVDRELLPTAAQMISDQTGIRVPYEPREAMELRYQADL